MNVRMRFPCNVARIALSCLVAACSATDAAPEGDPVEAAVALASLGVAIPGCANSGFSNGTLTLDVSADPLVLSASGGKLAANGVTCLGAGRPLTTLTVTKIKINGNASDNTVILDFQPGTFGPKLLSSAGGIDVDFGGGAGADKLMIRGMATAETYKLGKSSTSADVYIEVSGDKVADIRVEPGTASLALTVALGAGNDTMTASPTALDITSYAGAAVTVTTMTLGVTAYGGTQDDKLTGGDGDDALHGGAGADSFKMSAQDDGSDVYSGGDGTDTVDYGNRTGDLHVDLGPPRAAVTGTTDLATEVRYGPDGDIAGETLLVAVDGGSSLPVVFGTPSSPGDVLTAINAVISPLATAALNGRNRLVITSASSAPSAGVAVSSPGFSTDVILGLAGQTSGLTDADDGLSNEGDDVQHSTENIVAGSGHDELIGNELKNSIKGGLGNDILSGGGNTTCGAASDGDTLVGEGGNDTFYLPVANCWAVLTGGAGNNAADFSARSVALDLSNNGIAADGATGEKVNIGVDILTLVGGFAADKLLGGSGADTLVGGAGGDILNGALGADTVDYSATSEDLEVSLCFAATIAGCGAADDGADSEGDQVYLVERVLGGSGVDLLTAAGARVPVTIDGGSGGDTILGGDSNDSLSGGADDDTLIGNAGSDMLQGGPGSDTLIGDQDDICITDGSDVPTVGCAI